MLGSLRFSLFPSCEDRHDAGEPERSPDRFAGIDASTPTQHARRHQARSPDRRSSVKRVGSAGFRESDAEDEEPGDVDSPVAEPQQLFIRRPAPRAVMQPAASKPAHKSTAYHRIVQRDCEVCACNSKA